MAETKYSEQDGKLDYFAMYEQCRQQLEDAQREIGDLKEINLEYKTELRELRKELDQMTHEDEVVITTKHPIKDIEITFRGEA